ncbi:hypothetical protein SASPL_121169 [Salvia splendens]|uniref:Uncharacterized protein n=1 Tax=Salvia splendens TaxID=180675 RepID=A0A8X8ZVV0_SALSN|nr:hypothetical protein SASPL_121169 [Salvia splendens]
MPGFQAFGGEDVSLLSHPDPVVLELNRLQNQLKGHLFEELGCKGLATTIKELEEAIRNGGVTANTIRDYKPQISELNDEKRTLERELARIKVSANRAEMQKLKDKLAISERAAKAEAQLKDKLKLRLKTIEEGLKNASSFSINTNGSHKDAKSSNFFGILSSNNRAKKRSMSQPRGSTITKSAMQMLDEKQTAVNAEMKPIIRLKKKNPISESLSKKSLWASRNKVTGNSGKENAETNKNAMVNDNI